MKFKMAKNSLFAILLRSSWWISAGIATAMVALAFALLPEKYQVVGAFSAFPFVVLTLLAARRQWKEPSAARVEQSLAAVRGMTWPVFSGLLEQAFARDRFSVQRRSSGVADFELSRDGRRMLVSAKRWKSARTGVDALRALQAERMASEVEDAMVVSLGELGEAAVAFAAEHRIAVWQSAEVAQALQGLTVPGVTAR